MWKIRKIFCSTDFFREISFGEWFSYFLHLQDLVWPKKKISFAKWQQVQFFCSRNLFSDWLTLGQTIFWGKSWLLDYDFLYIPPNLSHWQSCWLALALVNQSPWLKVQFAKKKTFSRKKMEVEIHTWKFLENDLILEKLTNLPNVLVKGSVKNHYSNVLRRQGQRSRVSVIMASSILSNLSAFVALRLTVLLNVLNSILWGTKSRKRKIFQTDFGSCLLWRFKNGRPPRRRLGFFDARGFSFISVDEKNIESLLEIVLEAFFEYIFDGSFSFATF